MSLRDFCQKESLRRKKLNKSNILQSFTMAVSVVLLLHAVCRNKNIWIACFTAMAIGKDLDRMCTFSTYFIYDCYVFAPVLSSQLICRSHRQLSNLKIVFWSRVWVLGTVYVCEVTAERKFLFRTTEWFSFFTSKVDPLWTLPRCLYYRYHSDVLLLGKQQYD